MKKLSDLFRKKNKKIKDSVEINSIHIDETIEGNLNKNIDIIKEELGQSSDLVVRQFCSSVNLGIEMSIIYIDGLADKKVINEFSLKSLMNSRECKDVKEEVKKENLLEYIEKNIILDSEIKKANKFRDIFLHILSGDSIILVDGFSTCFVVSTKGFEDRGVQEPSSQNVIRGPRDGFCETLKTNITLIRRRIKNTNLRIEQKVIGKETNTDVAIAYIKGIADEKIINEVRNRIDKIRIDSILESGYIEELIQDEPYTLFPTIYNTERPDSVSAGLLEGRIAILVDGTPFVLLVPALFIQFFQSPEDYYQRADISSLIRILRYVAFFLALLSPALFIAVTTFHQEMIPPALLISIVAQREGIPFPALIEALIMELTFEILREAGVRMPKAIGTAISIVGALVLGEAAVQAGLVSPAKVIVVSITALASFISPSYNLAMTVRILRFIFMLLAATFGLFGIALGLLTMLLHLCSLRSFGIPYMYPLAPFNLSGQKDILVRTPIWRMFKRPELISNKNSVRQQSPKDAKPKKP